MNSRTLRSSLATLLHLFVVKIVSLWKLSFIFGSKIAFFSASVCAEPIIGAITTPLVAFSYMALRLLLASLYAPSYAFLLVYHIPRMCGTAYFSLNKNSALARILFTFFLVTCMFLFALHPVGSEVFWYGILWSVPLMVVWFNPQHFFYHALASTFTSHAVGTLLWLFLMPTDAAFWMTLFPLVLIERTAFACGMTLYYIVLSYLVPKCCAFITQRDFHGVRVAHD